jgi:hypothetical protein
MTAPALTVAESLKMANDTLQFESGVSNGAGVLTGTETIAISRGNGLLQTTASALATLTLSALAPQRQSIPVLTAGQAAYVTQGYSVGVVNVFVAGIRLNPAQYQALDGTNVVITDANVLSSLVVGMTVDIDASVSIAVAGVATPASVAALIPTNQPASNPLTGAELFSVTQGSGLFQSTLTKIANFVNNLVNPTNLSAAAALTGNELVPVSQSGGLVQSTASNVANWMIQTFSGILPNATGTVGRSVSASMADQPISAKAFGAKGNGITLSTGAITTGTNAFSATGAAFTTADVGKTIVVQGAGAAGAPLTTTISGYVSATAVTLTASAGTTVSSASFIYGTDDTAALQAFVTYVTNNSRNGYIPEGTYLISAALNIAQGGNYRIVGAGKNSTIIKQVTNNIAIFSMGATGNAACVFVEFAHMYLSYVNTQSGNTSAYAMYLQASYYFCSFHHLRWEGYTGFRVASGQPAPQNTKWDEIDCTAATYGSMMDWTGTTNAGPNWVMGRMQIACNNMVGPAFNNIKGINANIDCLEFLTPTNTQLMLVQSGSSISINTIKMEVYTYNVAGNLFVFNNGCNIKINQFFCYGTTGVFNPASGSFTLFNTNTGGNTGSLHIDLMSVTATTVGSGNVYLFQGAVGFITVDTLVTDGNANWQLTNDGASTTAETLTIRNIANTFVSQDNGNITTLALTPGADTTQVFNTALTAPCVATLPSNGNYLFNGLTYTFISNGAVNGSNTITINNGNAALVTMTSDQTAVTVVWRRNAAHGYAGWVVKCIDNIAIGDALTYTNVSGQSIPSAAATTVTTWTKTSDRLGTSLVASTGIFTCPATGFYSVAAQVTFASHVGVVNAQYSANVVANGVTVASGAHFQETTATDLVSVQTGSVVVFLSAGQTLVLQAYQNTGSAVALSTTAALTYMSINRIP